MSKSAGGFDVQLPRSLKAERRGDIAVLFLARAEKRNAIDDPTVFGIEAFFAALPDAIKAVVLAGEGDHFCSGLDLGELTSRGIAQGIAHSRSWHRAFERIEFGKAPVVAVLHGAVVGGGLEIAAACHIRVAEASAYYALPEGSRGIFVGGGGSVRLPPLLGVARMMDMMLTGRTLGAEEGQALGCRNIWSTRAPAWPRRSNSLSASPATRRSPISPSPICCRASPRSIRPQASPPKR